MTGDRARVTPNLSGEAEKGGFEAVDAIRQRPE
jgi:hypothetical protein